MSERERGRVSETQERKGITRERETERGERRNETGRNNYILNTYVD